MQTDNQSFGGSTPSIAQSNDATPFLTENSKANDIDNGPMRCYYDVEKIDYGAPIFMNCREPSSCESSSSTDNSIYYSDARESDVDLKEVDITLRATESMLMRGSTANSSNGSNSSGVSITRRTFTPRCKNSVENLSEDSGFGDFTSVKLRSKSIPNLYNEESLLEEDEECGKSFDDIQCNEIHSRMRRTNPKINTLTGNPTTALLISAKNNSTSNDANETCSNAQGENFSYRKSSSASNISTSLPDILDHISIFADVGGCDRQRNNIIETNFIFSGKSSNGINQSTSLFDKQIVSSVPNDLNIFSSTNVNICETNFDANVTSTQSSKNCRDHGTNANNWKFSNRNAINSVWPQATTTSDTVASKNFDLAQAFSASPTNTFYLTLPTASTQQTFRQQRIINSSYSNLTLLDYSETNNKRTFTSFQTHIRTMTEQQRHNNKRDSDASIRSGSGEFSRCNFLLDEISAHFDRNLSILNDRGEESDLNTDFLLETKKISSVTPPQPPPRKQSLSTKQSIGIEHPDRPDRQKIVGPKLLCEIPSSSFGCTFDQDPTNLKTCYASSLERCNFDVDEPLSKESSPFSSPTYSTPSRREFVASTPNLSHNKRGAKEEKYIHASSVHNSLNQLPQSSPPEITKSILSAAGSKNSLGKGVSFYPYVSEISWLEQSSAEDAVDGSSEAEISDNESNDESDIR